MNDIELKESEIPLFQGRCTLNFKTKMYEKDYCIVNGNLFSFAFCARRECLREEKEEKNALRIGRYFRSDYIGKELLKNFFLASIGYILVLAVAVLYHIEWLVDEIDTIDLQFAAGCLIASYLCFLAVYSIAVYVISTIRYQGAQKKLKWYGKELDDLQNMYEEQEKSGKKSGRRRKET